MVVSTTPSALPGGIQTHDPPTRNRVLYQTELQRVPMASIISESTNNTIIENGATAGMNQRNARTQDRPTITVKPWDYEPTEEELNEPIRIDATPEELALAVLRPVRVIEDPDA